MQTSPEKNVMAGRLASSTRKPTDFTQRNVKLKIFVLLGALMLVLAFAERARDPKFWKWLADIDKWGESEADTVKNRLTPQALRTQSDPEGTFVAASDDATQPKKPLLEDDSAKLGQLDPVERAWDQGWKDVFNRLNSDQRTLLFEILRSGGTHQPLAAEKTEAAANLLAEMTTLWEDYQAVAFQSLVTLTPDDQSLWVDVLRRVNRRWSDDVRPSLQAVLDGRTPTESEERLLAGFQKSLDTLALARITDDTIFLRPDEREIWLRLEGRVQDASPAELKKESVGHVTYLQLFKQPDQYRGKVITFRGTAKRAYRVPAPENYLGVKDHVVYWIMPEGGPSSPIVVYAQNTPAEFPNIDDHGSENGMTKLHEDIVVTGVFLKRGAYLGKDGTYTAPLIIANTPEWIRRPEGLGDPARFMRAPAWLWPVVGGAIAMALAMFGFTFWRVRRSEKEALQMVAEAQAHGPLDLEHLAVRPSTAEALREMEQREQERSS